MATSTLVSAASRLSFSLMVWVIHCLSFTLADGQVHDDTVATCVLNQIDISGSTILADKAFTDYSFREYIADRDTNFCIPQKFNERNT